MSDGDARQLAVVTGALFDAIEERLRRQRKRKTKTEGANDEDALVLEE